MFALSPFINVPITAQDTVIEVVSRGRGEQPHDEVFVSTTLKFAAPATEDIKLLLPLSAADGQKPLVRIVDQPIADAIGFDLIDRSVYDQQLVTALQAAQAQDQATSQAFYDAVQQAELGGSQAILPIHAGETDLRFFFSVGAAKTAEGYFQLEVLGPLASFLIQPGGSISVIAVLPRGAQYRDAVALQTPTDPSSVLPISGQADLGGRTSLGWLWQNDPLFRISWTY